MSALAVLALAVLVACALIVAGAFALVDRVAAPAVRDLVAWLKAIPADSPGDDRR